MAQQDPVPSYGCLMHPGDYRKIHEPADERIVPRVSRFRRAVARLAAALR